MKKRMIKAALSTAMAGMVVLPMSAIATNGNQPVANGQASRGMAGAGIAYAQDTGAVITNPASGVQLENRVDIGFDIFNPDRDLTLGGQTFDGNETDIFLVPELGYNRQIGSDSAFSIVMSAAGGQNTDYANHPLLGGPSEVNLSQVFLVPSYSKKVGNNSFGIGLVMVYQQFDATGLGALAANSQEPDKFSNNGTSDSTGVGVSVGWIGEINEALTLGATYQPEIGMSEFDEYTGLFPGGSVDIPEKFGLGIAYAATDKFDIVFDVTQVNYSDTKALGNPTHGDGRSPLGADTGPGFGWDDIAIYRLGIAYKASPELTLRAGLNHGDNPVPNESFNDAFFNSLTPAVSQDHLALGFTKKISSGLSLTGSYVRTFDATVEGNGTKQTEPGKGTPAADLRMDQNAVGLTLTWHL